MTFHKKKKKHFTKITEKEGKPFMNVIGQNPSPWRQFNVISCFFSQHLCMNFSAENLVLFVLLEGISVPSKILRFLWEGCDLIAVFLEFMLHFSKLNRNASAHSSSQTSYFHVNTKLSTQNHVVLHLNHTLPSDIIQKLLNTYPLQNSTYTLGIQFKTLL